MLSHTQHRPPVSPMHSHRHPHSSSVSRGTNITWSTSPFAHSTSYDATPNSTYKPKRIALEKLEDLRASIERQKSAVAATTNRVNSLLPPGVGFYPLTEEGIIY